MGHSCSRSMGQSVVVLEDCIQYTFCCLHNTWLTMNCGPDVWLYKQRHLQPFLNIQYWYVVYFLNDLFILVSPPNNFYCILTQNWEPLHSYWMLAFIHLNHSSCDGHPVLCWAELDNWRLQQGCTWGILFAKKSRHRLKGTHHQFQILILTFNYKSSLCSFFS